MLVIQCSNTIHNPYTVMIHLQYTSSTWKEKTIIRLLNRLTWNSNMSKGSSPQLTNRAVMASRRLKLITLLTVPDSLICSLVKLSWWIWNQVHLTIFWGHQWIFTSFFVHLRDPIGWYATRIRYHNRKVAPQQHNQLQNEITHDLSQSITMACSYYFKLCIYKSQVRNSTCRTNQQTKSIITWS